MKVLDVVKNKPAGITVLERNGCFVAVFEEPCSKTEFNDFCISMGAAEDLAFSQPAGDDGLMFASAEAVEKTRRQTADLAAAMGCSEMARIVMLDDAQAAADDALKAYKHNDRELILGVVIGLMMGGMGPKVQVESLRNGTALGALGSTKEGGRITQQMLSEFASELEAYYEQRKETN